MRIEMIRARRLAVCTAVVAGFVTAQVGATAASAASPATASSEHAVAAKKKARSTVNRRLYKHFKLLHKKQSARKAIADELVPPLPWGVTLAPARSVTTPNGVSVTVAPGTEGACILLTAPDAPRTVGVGCLPTALVLKGEQWTYIPGLGGPGGTLAGMAPDNYVAALVTHADGSLERAPVVNNVWSVTGRASLTNRKPDEIPPTSVQQNTGAEEDRRVHHDLHARHVSSAPHKRDPLMKTHVKHRVHRKALAILAGAAVAAAAFGAAAGSASAYSCVPYGSANWCRYYDGTTAASILRVGTWHSLQWSMGTNNASPYNRTVYVDIIDGPCSCIRGGRSAYGSGYAQISGIQDNTFTYWNYAQPRSMLVYEAGNLLGEEIY